MRGKGSRIPGAIPTLRITPACAGKRMLFTAPWNCSKDHPRVCGEKPPSCPAMWMMWGSPPRVRGKAYTDKDGNNRKGITPACAGKRSCCPHFLQTRRDHPRVCGEKRSNGSPTMQQYRITPACAGKSQHFPTKKLIHRDHPRVCGEKEARKA